MSYKSTVELELQKKKRFDCVRYFVMISMIVLAIVGIGYWVFDSDVIMGENAMIDLATNVQYSGTDKKDNFYKIYGETVSKKLKHDQNILVIKKPIIEYLDEQNKWFRITSKFADYNKTIGKIVFQEDVKFFVSEGVLFSTNTAQVITDTMLITGDDHITGKGERFDLEAQSGFKVEKSKDFITFYGPADFKIYSEGSEQPIHVTAQEYLEINQKHHYYAAKGKAHALLQKGEEVSAEKLLAYYDEVSDKTELKLLKGFSNIKINKEDFIITGDTFEYKLQEKYLKVMGKNIHVFTKSGKLIAHQQFEYLEQQNLIKALGNVRLDNLEGDVVYCDRLKAFLSEEGSTQNIIAAHLNGHVKIVTKKGDIAYSDRAIYDKVKEKVYLYDHVVLDRGSSRLMGDEAVIEMLTGKSYLINQSKEKKQIIGILKKQN